MEVCVIQQPVVVTCPSAQVLKEKGDRERGHGGETKMGELWTSPQLCLGMVRPDLQPEISPPVLEEKTKATQSCALLLHKHRFPCKYTVHTF